MALRERERERESEKGGGEESGAPWENRKSANDRKKLG
jgi:hypothetical protein